MKIILDTEALKKKGRDVDTALYLLSLLSGCPITQNTFEKARQQRLIKLKEPYMRERPFPETVELSDTGKYLAESLMAESNTSESEEERLIALADALREIFPAGKKPGYAQTWRDSTSCIVDRLQKFYLKYKPMLDKKGIDYSDKAIIRVTKEYVSSFNGSYQYMQLLKYFIWKNKITGEHMERGRIVGELERQSQLAAMLEDTKGKQINHDWDVELR